MYTFINTLSLYAITLYGSKRASKDFNIKMNQKL